MVDKSGIERTDATWNPVTGCDKVSPGCKHCYVERTSARLKAMGVAKYKKGFDVAHHPDVLNQPIRWTKPRRIFINSMSDILHKDIPADFVVNIFDTMNKASHHTFQLLTKRPERLPEIEDLVKWTQNIWMGTSVESERYLSRIDDLRQCPAKIKFLSLEPLLGPLPDIDLTSIDWAIVGGESGPGARIMHAEWVRDIREQCQNAGVHFFFKQWGGANKRATGRDLDGRTWDDIPMAASAAG